MRKLALVVVGAAMLAAAPASASTFLATSYSLGSGQNAAMSLPVPQNVFAGEIILHSADGDLSVWCLDLLNGINLPYLYNVNTYAAGDVYPGMQVLGAGQLRQIASLMFHGVGETALGKAATQLAIWKVEYGALFNPTGLSVGLQAAYDGKLLQSIIGGLLDCPSCILTVLTDAPINPSQAFGYAVSAVPIPPALVLFASGLVGLALIARRRRKVAAPVAA